MGTCNESHSGMPRPYTPLRARGLRGYTGNLENVLFEGSPTSATATYPGRRVGALEREGEQHTASLEANLAEVGTREAGALESKYLGHRCGGPSCGVCG